jgi:hypothetical protein
MRTIEAIDGELRILAAVRATARDRGGEPTAAALNQLLDERLEICTAAEAVSSEC